MSVAARSHRSRSSSNAQAVSTGKTQRIVGECAELVRVLAEAVQSADENAMNRALSDLLDKARESKNRCKAMHR